MKFIDEVTRMISEYPSIFPNRLHAMNQLFCVIGNGYEWKNGELVCGDHVSPEQRLRTIEQYNLIVEAAETILAADPTNKFAKEKLVRLEEERHISNDAYELARVYVDKLTPLLPGHDATFYPLCEYSKIRNVPTDVQPDWKEAIEEMTLILAKHNIKV